ncbi:accessory gene regulator B family protein [Paenibacillus sp. IB182496]|uniref:Accessory gene regulator B family protein n=1 Tax=Paenibacillus sabuli TaxID=2772509 RepID=A0A927GRP4_9BACL|nr:accessory gene regulator B family protein [Paenibacillus sabuli]MBD2845718.1 accessory gene regulator B family protein [Paenibacillus sabuli]
MLERLSVRLASRIRAEVPDHPRSEAVLAYGLKLMFNTAATLLLGVLLGMLLGMLSRVLLALGAFALLRVLSGGYHFRSALVCVIVSSVGAAVLAYVQLSPAAVAALNGINALLVLGYAPSGIERQSRIPAAWYPHLRAASLLIVLSNFWFQSPLLAATWFLQAVSLLRRR